MAEIAKVFLSMGRWHLEIAGFVLATEGDRCRDGGLPEEVLNPISPKELAAASIGGEPVSKLPIGVVRFFRGDNWNKRMMLHVAAAINRITWTKVPPSIRGWYWCTNDGDRLGETWEAIVRIDDSPTGLICSWMTAPGQVAFMRCEDWSRDCLWAGPISPPENDH